MARLRSCALVRAGLAHAQFETIHPFLDGNGRVGRLLITLLLCHHGVLEEPLLLLSLYFKEHRQDYYALLDGIRRDGDWEAWLRFFLEGVAQTAGAAVSTAMRLDELFRKDRERIEQEARAAGSVLRLHRVLCQRPITSLRQATTEPAIPLPRSQQPCGNWSACASLSRSRAEGKADSSPTSAAWRS